MAQLIVGTQISAEVRAKLKEQVDAFKASGVQPGLAIIRVGERPDSVTYVNMKKKAAEEMGVKFFLEVVPETIQQDEIMALVKGYNDNPEVDGILVQLPLPEHLIERDILNAISIEKDVDGFHPYNIGAIAMKGVEPFAIPATPKGCMELLDTTGVKADGKKAVVIGRSNIVGLPVSLLLLNRNATVTVCHSRTPIDEMKAAVQQADIVVVAVGKAGLVKGDWVKPGAVVIDCGINSIVDTEGKTKSGFRLVGDVATAEVQQALGPSGFITPVPGGVGPMTIAMLFSNLLNSVKRCVEKKKAK